MSGPPEADNLIRSTRFLVVDDNAPWIRLVREVLLAWGAVAVRGVSSVAQAQAVLEKHDVGMIISDLVMPEEDGFSLVRWVRAHENPVLQRTPFAIITSETSRLNITRAACCGADLVIEKPLKPALLLPRMKALLAARAAKPRPTPPCGKILTVPCPLIPIKPSPSEVSATLKALVSEAASEPCKWMPVSTFDVF
ncbi:DNA-binding response OmpR family regulator [Caulobacter ginsengisoli]|uniref:DNA-binding response OmpR family regulator n=1 Tax=Caulobacter ginsengisoli TaxID=400775 RepID=A0ABU0IXY3_9CAUL|nr:response regulator [Caulobacter ginsengisoli]MDQ0466878.1 DNA-binding response OmpR family regulator [Caulobacter ginsengisoli]